MRGSKYGEGEGPIIYSVVNCGGWEGNITQCDKITYPSCSRKNTAGVQCSSGEQ